jgi:hypothetical protein
MLAGLVLSLNASQSFPPRTLSNESVESWMGATSLPKETDIPSVPQAQAAPVNEAEVANSH